MNWPRREAYPMVMSCLGRQDMVLCHSPRSICDLDVWNDILCLDTSTGTGSGATAEECLCLSLREQLGESLMSAVHWNHHQQWPTKRLKFAVQVFPWSLPSSTQSTLQQHWVHNSWKHLFSHQTLRISLDFTFQSKQLDYCVRLIPFNIN